MPAGAAIRSPVNVDGLRPEAIPSTLTPYIEVNVDEARRRRAPSTLTGSPRRPDPRSLNAAVHVDANRFAKRFATPY